METIILGMYGKNVKKHFGTQFVKLHFGDHINKRPEHHESYFPVWQMSD